MAGDRAAATNQSLGGLGVVFSSNQSFGRRRRFGTGSAILLGLLVAGAGVHGLIDGARTSHWRETSGRVTNVSRERYHDGVERRTRYRAKASYEYRIGGLSYSGSCAGATASAGLRDWMHRSGAARSVGDDVAVWYDPDNPDQAVLQRSDATIDWSLTVGGALFAAWAGLAWRTRRDRFRIEAVAPERSGELAEAAAATDSSPSASSAV